MVSVCVQYFDLYKLPKSKLTNANILYMVQFGSGQNKLVQLLIRSRNSGGRIIRSLLVMVPEQVLVLYRRRTTSFRSGLGTFVVGQCEALSLDI